MDRAEPLWLGGARDSGVSCASGSLPVCPTSALLISAAGSTECRVLVSPLRPRNTESRLAIRCKKFASFWIRAY